MSIEDEKAAEDHAEDFDPSVPRHELLESVDKLDGEDEDNGDEANND